MNSAAHFGLFHHLPDGEVRAATDDEIIAIARDALDAKIKRQGNIATPADAKAFVSLRLGALPYEVFAVIHVDAHHRIIEYREMFRGTLTQTSVWPREVARDALALNSAGVLLSHCHPSGADSKPSRADEVLTNSLRNVLAMIDVRVLDHLVVAGGRVTSFAEMGLL